MAIAPASGTFGSYQPGTFAGIPRFRAFCNILIHLQRISIVPTWTGNVLGVQTSNLASVTTGCYTSPVPGYWWIGAHVSNLQEGTSFAAFGGYAVRIN